MDVSNISIRGFKIGEYHFVGGGPEVKLVESTRDVKCQKCAFKLDHDRCELGQCFIKIDGALAHFSYRTRDQENDL